ncbi:MAG: protein phosphatase [Myxococcota bacterium]
MSTRPGPWTGTYWVDPGRLLIGNHPGGSGRAATLERLGALLGLGIRTFVSLMEEDPRGLEAYGEPLGRLAAEQGVVCECLRFPIEDCSVPTRAQMRRILAAIDQSLARGHAVYAHCWGGRGRAGILAGVWLIRSGAATPASVLDEIGRLRGRDPREYPSPETAEQQAFVRSFRDSPS